MKLLNNKKLLWLSAGISLLGVFVASVATAAWFQLDSQPIKTSLVSSTPNISINNDDIYGYKVKQNIGSNGFIDYSSTTVAKIQGSQIAGTNIHQDDEDINFDVPSGGIGYYLIKKNPGGSYKYNYSGTPYSWKFNEYASSNRSYVSSLTLAANDMLIVKKYTFEDNKTVNKQVDISSTYGANSSVDNNAVTITTAGTYKVWYDSGNNTIGFEDFTPISNRNIQSRITRTKKDMVTLDTSKMYLIVPDSTFSGWGTITNVKCYFTGANKDVSFSHDDDKGYYLNVPSGTTGFYFKFQENGLYWQAGANGNAGNNYSLTYSAGKQYSITSVAWYADGGGGGDANNYKCANITVSSATTLTGSKTVYLYDPEENLATNNSTVPYAYAWNNGYKNAGWPGVAMTRVRDFYYSVDVPSYLTNLIFTNSDGSEQSSDLTTPTSTSSAYDYSASEWYNPNATVATTYTYYLYDPNNFYEGNGYVKYWSDKYTMTSYGPVAMTNTGTTRLFSITINANYDHLLFCKTSSYGTQTADLVIPQTDKYYVLSSGTTGTWKTLSATSGSRTIRLYDPNGWLGATPKIYAFESSISHYPTMNADWPGVAMTQSNARADGHLYTATIPTTYNKIMFANSGGTIQTADGGMTPDGSKYYVLTSKEGNVVSGHWYTSLASETMNTYYFYDNRASGRWTAPHAYAWKVSGLTNDVDNYSIYPCRVAAWPGIAMTQATEHAAEVGVESTYLWSITVSSSYDKIIFAKDSSASSSNYSHQTIDLSTSGNDGKMCVLTTQVTSGDDTGKWTVQWANTFYGVTFKASFFIGGTKSSITSQTLDADTAIELASYSPTYVAPNNLTKAVASSGTIYYFSKVNASWYTDENCTLAYSATAPTASLILYAKYNVDVSNYKDIYIDTSNTDWGDSVYVFDGTGSTDPYFGAYKAAPGLFRVTVPQNWTLRVSKNDHYTGNTDGTWWSEQIVVDSLSSGTYGLVTSSGDNNRPFSVKSLESTSYGTASIQTYVGNNWVTQATMEVGDGSSNYFVYEHGLRIAVDTKVRVVVSGSSAGANGTYAYSSYLVPPGTTTPYVVQDEDEINIKTAEYTDNARFNFYVTTDKKLTIAMVPDLGNGYYIMNYNSTNGTNNYISETKMSSSSKTRAIYDGYYATAGKQVYIRSYLDAVDTLYKTLSSSSSAYATINSTTGVITITSAGYYAIEVDNGTISISGYNIADDFKLNKLDVSKNTSKAEIWSQKTSIVLEVPFTCDNTYASTVSLNVDSGNLSNFIGVSLYVTNTAGKLADPYTTLRGSNSSTRSTYYNSLSNAATVNDLNNFTIPANSGAEVYYAYILIDYLPTGSGVDYTNFANSGYLTGQVWFYLKDSQA